MSSSERKYLGDKYLTELSLLAKQLYPEGRVEATTEGFEDEDGDVRIYPPATLLIDLDAEFTPPFRARHTQ